MRVKRANGFTLIELMVAVTILVIIGGVAYTSYNAAIRVYQKHQARLEAVQRCRAALEQITRDLENLFFINQDEDLVLTTLDMQSQEGIDRDGISFVRIVDPRYEFYQFVENQKGEQWTPTSLEEAEGTPVNTDLIRVGYMIAEDPNLAEKEVAFNLGTQSSQTSPPMSLYRITTHTLNYDEGLAQVFDGDVSPSDLVETEEAWGEEKWMMYQSESQLKATGEKEALLKSEVIAENAIMLDFKYFDGEEWFDSWEEDQQGRLPKAVMVTLSVTDEKGKVTVTEATVVHLKLGGELPSEGMGGQGEPGLAPGTFGGGGR